jgi:hypothetical protein
VQGIDTLAFPTVLEIDYLRLYQWDYALHDFTSPEKPAALATSQLDNTIHWNRPTDDTWVSHYAIYLDGVKYREAKINQYTFVGLEQRDYQVQVEAIDFVGRTSPLSDAITFTFGG